MARFDVHRGWRASVPYLLDIQADLLDVLPTRLVIPLLPAGTVGMRIDRLHLPVEIDGRPLVVATNLMTSVRRDQLGPKIGSLAERWSEIVAAVDFLQQGF